MTKKNSNVRFTDAEKRALLPGQEMTDGEVIWRKLAEGTGTWRYDFRMQGRRYKGSLGREKDGVTLSQARDELKRVRAKATLESPKPSGSSGLQKRPFDVAAEDFLRWSAVSHQDYRHNRGRMDNYLIPHFGDQPIGDISPGDVESFRSDLFNQGLGRATVKRIISLLSNVFEHARQSDPAIANPTRELRPLRPRPDHVDVFSERDVEKLLDPGTHPDVRDRAMVALARFAGLRASEVLGLAWDDVDLKSCSIQVRQTVVDGKLVPTTKSGKARSVPISKRLFPVLEQLHQNRDSGWLFPGKNPAKPMHQVQHVFRRMKRRAGLDNGSTFHSLRHRFATSALENGATVHVLQDWLGHSSIQMTERYVHVSGLHRQDMAALLT